MPTSSTSLGDQRDGWRDARAQALRGAYASGCSCRRFREEYLLRQGSGRGGAVEYIKQLYMKQLVHPDE